MPRRYRMRYRYARGGKSRYSNETCFINWTAGGEIDAGTTFPLFTSESGDEHGIVVVPPTGTYGTRKVKNFTISISCNNIDYPIACALVYVPEGTLASTMNLGAVSGAGNFASGVSLYEPNQNVIAQFIIPPSTMNNGIVRYSTRLARNLSSGDRIVLIFGTAFDLGSSENPAQMVGTVNYAIKY